MPSSRVTVYWGRDGRYEIRQRQGRRLVALIPDRATLGVPLRLLFEILIVLRCAKKVSPHCRLRKCLLARKPPSL